jgi:hypothetical protein
MASLQASLDSYTKLYDESSERSNLYDVIHGMRNENNRLSMLSLRRLLPAVALTFLAGCAAIPTPVVLSDQPFEVNTFNGMSALAETAPQRPLHVLLIQGMGTPQPYGFDAFIASLAGRFGLVQIPPHEPQAQWHGCYDKTTPAQPFLLQPAPQVIQNSYTAPGNEAQLYTYDFAPRPEDRPTLTVSYLLWTPLTESVKCGLEKEDDSAPAKQDFASFAKDFIDDKLADAVLYGGAYREKVIRPSIQAALCLVASRDHKTCAPGDYRDPTVIITHSLGGYMLMDAIADELRADCQSKSGGGAAEKILENTPVIYMMANQLALLDLSTLHRDPEAPKPKIPESAPATNHFAQCWIQARRARALHEAKSSDSDETKPVSQVVAFSDPNDILSWRLEPRNLKLPKPVWGEVVVTNVYMSNNEFSIPGVISDPVNAHTGYFVNPAVMDMLICGMKDGVVQSCPARAAAL